MVVGRPPFRCRVPINWTSVTPATLFPQYLAPACRQASPTCADPGQPDAEEEKTPLPPLDPFEKSEEHQSHPPSMPMVNEGAPPSRNSICRPPSPSGALGENPMLRRPRRTKARRKRANGSCHRLYSGEPPMVSPSTTAPSLPPIPRLMA
jgi:hypothetical protein